jgi:hypothetical protein
MILQLGNQLENINLKLLENMSNIFEIMLKWIDIPNVSVVEESYEIKEWIKSMQKNLTEGLRRSQEEQFEANNLVIEIDNNRIWC